MAKLKKYTTFESLKLDAGRKHVSRVKDKDLPSLSELKAFLNLLRKEYSKKKKPSVINGK